MFPDRYSDRYSLRLRDKDNRYKIITSRCLQPFYAYVLVTSTYASDIKFDTGKLIAFTLLIGLRSDRLIYHR